MEEFDSASAGKSASAAFDSVGEVDGTWSDETEFARLIAENQRDVVWCGGNQYTGCYTDEHARRFLASDEPARIVEKFKSRKEFDAGVDAMRKLPK